MSSDKSDSKYKIIQNYSDSLHMACNSIGAQILEEVALVLGSDEEDGEDFGEGVEEQLDALATVPMKDFDPAAAPRDTLNLAAAAAIVAYERSRQLERKSWWQQLKIMWDALKCPKRSRASSRRILWTTLKEAPSEELPCSWLGSPKPF